MSEAPSCTRAYGLWHLLALSSLAIFSWPCCSPTKLTHIPKNVKCPPILKTGTSAPFIHFHFFTHHFDLICVTNMLLKLLSLRNDQLTQMWNSKAYFFQAQPTCSLYSTFTISSLKHNLTSDIVNIFPPLLHWLLHWLLPVKHLLTATVL